MTQPGISTARTVAALLWPEFVVKSGCVFLKCVAHYVKDLRYPTRTEWDENHIHLLEEFAHGARLRREPFYNPRHRDFVAASELGRQMCFMWANKLRRDFPRWHFRVYFHGFDPIVRFHRVRPREVPIIGDKEMKEKVKTGELLIVDTRKLI